MRVGALSLFLCCYWVDIAKRQTCFPGGQSAEVSSVSVVLLVMGGVWPSFLFFVSWRGVQRL